MKKNKFLIIMSILTLMVTALGATFSFFRVAASSNEGAVSIEAAAFEVGLDVAPLYVGKKLLPLDNSNIMTAFNNNCVDYFGNGACQAYMIKVENAGQGSDYIGNIKFDLTDLTNLNYMVLDEDNNVYQNITTVVNGEQQSLGAKFYLPDGDSKTFSLIIWLPNFDRPQDIEDSNGNFGATISYFAGSGNNITGTFSANNS